MPGIDVCLFPPGFLKYLKIMLTNVFGMVLIVASPSGLAFFWVNIYISDKDKISSTTVIMTIMWLTPVMPFLRVSNI